MKKWPFEPLVFSEKSPEAMLKASREFYREIRKRRTVREGAMVPVIGK